MAHPQGANFKEGLLLVEYAYKAWRFRAEGFVTKYGADSASSANYGHNIFKSWIHGLWPTITASGRAAHNHLFC